MRRFFDSWQCGVVVALVILGIYGTGIYCDDPRPPLFQVQAGNILVPMVPGQGATWKHPLTFVITSGSPQVCSLEYTVQTFPDAGGAGEGPFTSSMLPFDVKASTLKDNDCSLGVAQDCGADACTARFRADCSLPLSVHEVLPPVQLSVADWASELRHTIAFEPIGASVAWGDCGGSSGGHGGSSVMGYAEIVYTAADVAGLREMGAER